MENKKPSKTPSDECRHCKHWVRDDNYISLGDCNNKDFNKCGIYQFLQARLWNRIDDYKKFGR